MSVKCKVVRSLFWHIVNAQVNVSYVVRGVYQEELKTDLGLLCMSRIYKTNA